MSIEQCLILFVVHVGCHTDNLFTLWVCSANRSVQEEWTTSACRVSLLISYFLIQRTLH